MKKTLFLLLLAVTPLCMLAQQKIATVNSEEIVSALPETKAAQTRMQELDKKYSEELQTMQQEYTKKTEAFVKESEKLSETIRNTRQQELIDMQNRIQQSAQVMQQDFQKQQETLLTPIRQKVLDAIKKVSDRDGYSYVVERMMMLHMGNDAIDITDKVKKELGL